MISVSNQRKLGVILQYSQMALNIVIQLIYTPILLNILGANEFGIYNLASSTISYLSLLSLGVGASYLRWYSIYKKNNEQVNINRLNGLYLITFTIIGIIALLPGLYITANVHWLFNETYSANDIATAQVLMCVLTVNLALSFPASVFTSYITSQERFIFQKTVNIGKTIISPAMNIVLLYLGYGSIGMVITTTVISIIIDVINIYYCFRKLHMRFILDNPNWGLLKEIFTFSIFIAINQVVDQINWQTDKIVLGKIVNGSSVAIYVIGSQINMMFTNFSSAIANVFNPKVNMIVAKNTADMDNELTDLFIRVGRIQWYILMLILSGFVFFGKYFVIRWAGTGYDNSYYVAVLLMAPAVVPLIQNVGIEIQRAKYKHKFRSIVYLFMAIFNVMISIWFSSMWAEIGAAMGTTLSLLLANGVIMNIYYQKSCGINVIAFWKSIISTLRGFIPPVTLGCVISYFYKFNSLLDFTIWGVVYVFVYSVSIYFFSFNIEEKELINGILNVIKKLRREKIE